MEEPVNNNCDYQVLLHKDWHVWEIQKNSSVKINCYLLKNYRLVGSCDDFVLTQALRFIGLNPIMVGVKDGPNVLAGGKLIPVAPFSCHLSVVFHTFC